MNKLSLFPIVFILTACGSESDSNGDSSQGLSEVSNVSGHYSFITSAIQAECTDGSTGTNPAIALSGTVTHTGNNVVFVNDDDGSTPGLTIIESDDMDGAIESSGRFVMNSSAIVKFEGISGNSTATYNLTGYFNDSGWSGDYVYSVFFQSLNASCKYKTTFEGYKD